MSMIIINGTQGFTPSEFEWGLQDISKSDSGRAGDTDPLMYKNRIGQKRKIQLSWNAPSQEETARILQSFNPEYINVTYPDAMSGVMETREFYVGDRSAPVKMWTVCGKRYSKVSFNIIER